MSRRPRAFVSAAAVGVTVFSLGLTGGPASATLTPSQSNQLSFTARSATVTSGCTSNVVQKDAQQAVVANIAPEAATPPSAPVPST